MNTNKYLPGQNVEELSFKVINFSTNHNNHFVVLNIREYYFLKIINRLILM